MRRPLAVTFQSRVRLTAVECRRWPREVTNVLVAEAALRTVVGSPEIMQVQRDHTAHLAVTVPHAKIGIVPIESWPILPLHGWEQRDGLISIETTAGDLEIADTHEVDQYRRWGELLTRSALFGADLTAINQDFHPR